MSVHAPEPPIDNTPIFGTAQAMPPTSGASFSCDVAQYAAFRSFYAATGGGIGPFPPPPPVLVGVISANTADGDVVITGVNGVAVSSGPTPTISLGDITPASLVASGTFTGGAGTADAALFPTSMSSGSVSVVTPVATISITSPTVSAASIAVLAQGSAASATIAGLVSAGTCAIPGALNIATIADGSMGASIPSAISYSTPGSNQITIAGWLIQWGISRPTALLNGNQGTTEIDFPPTGYYNGAYTIGIFPVDVPGQSPFICTVVPTPASSLFYVLCTKTGTPINGVVVSWITIGRGF